MSDRSSVSGSQGAAHHFALAKGTRLFEFEIGPVLGHGGFGITYRAVDTLLQEDVAIKEFLPNELAVRVSDETVKAKSAGDQDSFRTGLSTFLEEARMIARFRHPNIMQVRRFFELHGTGYIVLEYERGRTLSQRLADGPIGEAELRDLLLRLLDGLEAVHDRGILHRDLKPSNIIIRDNGTPVLIDFGAARDFTSRHSRSITAIAAPGYSPPEQYGVGGQQGPWTDFYALGAILYRCVTGSAPVDSLRRLRKDPLVPATVAAAGKYDAGLLGIIDWMVEVDEANRPESAAQIRAALAAGHAPSGHAPSAPSGAVAAETVSAAPTSVEVTKGAGGAAILGFSKESRADILDLAVHATPPGRYLTRAGTGQTSWSSEPNYLSLERAGPEAGRAAYVLDATLVAAIPPGARVEISSSDNFIRTGTDWPHWAVPAVPPRSPNRMLAIAAVLAGLAIVVVVAAMNLGALGDVACARLGLCSADRVALAQVQSCVAAARPCEARSCAATFKSQFAGSALMVRVAAIEDQAERRCRASEDTEFERANRCAEPKMMADPCGVASCFQGINSSPNSRNAIVARNMVERARASCTAAEARQRPADPPPAAAPAVTPPPRTDPPDTTTAPPIAAPVTPPAAPALPAAVLPNGLYRATQSYTGPKSRTDPRNCPPSDSFMVEVRGGTFTYSRPDVKDGVPITRTWTGNIDQASGRIAVMGSAASPPTKNALTIGGQYNEALVSSDFCGAGIFKIQR